MVTCSSGQSELSSDDSGGQREVFSFLSVKWSEVAEWAWPAQPGGRPLSAHHSPQRRLSRIASVKLWAAQPELSAGARVTRWGQGPGWRQHSWYWAGKSAVHLFAASEVLHSATTAQPWVLVTFSRVDGSAKIDCEVCDFVGKVRNKS